MTTLPIINLVNCTDVFPLCICYSVTVSTDNNAYLQMNIGDYSLRFSQVSTFINWNFKIHTIFILLLKRLELYLNMKTYFNSNSMVIFSIFINWIHVAKNSPAPLTIETMSSHNMIWQFLIMWHIFCLPYGSSGSPGVSIYDLK